MINTLAKNNNKSKLILGNLQDDVFLLPKWEKIKSFSISNNKFLFNKRSMTVDLYRRFSSKNSLEKYSVKYEDNKLIANIDLKIYKDCVYIINFDVRTFVEGAIEKLIQTAVEKALYNTSEKEIFINLPLNMAKRNKIKKILLNNEFIQEQSQSEYEKAMFGETYKLQAAFNSSWADKIKQMPILINK